MGASKRSGCTGTSSTWSGSSCSRSSTSFEGRGGHGDRAQASQLRPDLGVPGGPHGRRAGARLRAADFAQLEAAAAPVPGRLEGGAGRAVLHAPEVRALEPADHGDHPLAAGRDLHPGRHVGAHLVAFLELTKPRITQLVVLTAAAGFYLGSSAGVDVRLLVHTLIGVALVAAGTNAFNQWRERTTTVNTLIGAVPGALPIVGGWTAAGGALGPAVAALFWILFLWQLPHFLALAWIYREDYRRGGLAMLSVSDVDGRHTGRMVLLYATALVPVSLLPTLLGVTGGLYFFGALALGLAYAGASVAM